MAELRIEPCRSQCDWRRTQAELDDEPVFACASCRSEWVPSEPWMPANADGAPTDEVRRARRANGQR